MLKILATIALVVHAAFVVLGALLTGTAGKSTLSDASLAIALFVGAATIFVVVRLFAGPSWGVASYLALAMIFAPTMYVAAKIIWTILHG